MTTSVSYIVLKFGTLPKAFKLWADASYGIGLIRAISNEDYTILDDFFRNLTVEERRRFQRESVVMKDE